MRVRLQGGLALACVTFFSVDSLLAQQMPPVSIDPGDRAPSISCLDDRGWIWRSTDKLPNKYLVLIFYRGDFDKTSSARLLAYRDAFEVFAERDIDIIGVSGDTVATHSQFRDLFALSFPLLADVEAKVSSDFAVPTNSSGKRVRIRGPDGKRYPPNSRSWQFAAERRVTCQPCTFIISPDGIVLFRQTPADPARDFRVVLDFIDKHGSRAR